jgi:outer membrane protein
MKVFLTGLMMIFLATSISHSQTEILSLNDCVEIALKNNPAVVRMTNADESAAEDVQGSYAGILPLINLTASSGRVEAGARDTEGDVPIGVDSLGNYIYQRRTITQPGYVTNFNNFGISVNQNIFDGGEWWQAISYAKSQKRASTYDLASTINTTVYNTQEAFFNVLKQQKLLEVNQLAVERSADQLNKTEKMYELGAVAKVDVYRSKVNLGNDKIQMLLQENALLSAKQNLNLVMGRDPQSPVDIKPEFELPNSFPEVEELFQQAIENNPDIKKMTEEVESNDLAVSRSYAVLWPRLSVYMGYNRSHEGFEKVYNEWSKNWNMNWGVSLRFNLFNGFNDKVRIQKSKLALRSTQTTEEETKRTIKSNIANLVDNFNSYLQIISINKENLEAAKEEFRLAEERYRIGSGTALEVREAQVNLNQAEETLVAAQYNARITQANLEQFLGTIYKIYREKSE